MIVKRAWWDNLHNHFKTKLSLFSQNLQIKKNNVIMFKLLTARLTLSRFIKESVLFLVNFILEIVCVPEIKEKYGFLGALPPKSHWISTAGLHLGLRHLPPQNLSPTFEILSTLICRSSYATVSCNACVSNSIHCRGIVVCMIILV